MTEKDSRYSKGKKVYAPALAIFLFLFSVYALTYNGIFHMFDEWYYGVRARSAAGHIGPIVHSILSTLTKHGFLSALQASHRQPFILTLALIYRASQNVHWLGALQSMYVVNLFATALTGVFLFLSSIELGYDVRTSSFVALAFGVATPAWVYSETLLREPFAAMLLAGGVYFLLRIARRPLLDSAASLTISIGMFMLGVSTRVSLAAILPFVAFYVVAVVSLRLYAYTQPKIVRQGETRGATLALVGVVFLCTVMFVFALSYKITSSIEHSYMGYLKSPLFVFDLKHYYQALIGLIISPGRGLIIYSPTILLSIAGIYSFFKKHPLEAILLFFSTAGYVIATAHYTVWWGGWGWMSRYLIPFLPLTVLPMAPITSNLLSKERRTWRQLIAWILFLFGFMIQAIGAIWGLSMLAINTPHDASGAFTWRSAPFILQFVNRHTLSTDMVLAHMSKSTLVILIASIWVLTSFFAILTIYIASSESRRPLKAGFLVIVTVFSFLFLVWNLKEYFWFDTRYKAQNGYLSAIKTIKKQSKNSDVLLVDCYLEDQLRTSSRLLNFCDSKCPKYEVIAREVWEKKDEKEKSSWMDRVTNNKDRVWLIPTDLPPGSRNSKVEQWMDKHYFKQSCEWTGSTTRICLYYTYSKEIRATVVNHDIGFDSKILLKQATVQAVSIAQIDSREIEARPGGTLFITFSWKALEEIDSRYKVTIQLLDPSGTLVAQMDREIGDGFWPTNTWGKGYRLTERYAFPLPTSIPPGTYTICLGVYNPLNGELLPPHDSHEHLNKMATLVRVVVPLWRFR